MLRLSDLYIQPPERPPVQQIHLELAEGCVGLVLGGADAGKSAVLETIAVGDWPCLGKLSWRGQSLIDLSPPARRRLGIGYVFQNPRIIEGLTVAEHLALGRKATAKAMPWHLFDIVPELSAIERCYADQLATPLRRLVELGRALAGSPKLLLLDELTVDLGVTRMVELIGQLRELGLTLLIADRCATPLLPLADVGLVLAGGRMLLSGKAAELETDPRVVSVCVGDLQEDVF